MSDQLIEPRLLKGFRDQLPVTMQSRLQMLKTIEHTVKLFGFLPLETPTLEYADILLGKLGDEGEKLLYRFKDHGNRDVAMRYDFTVPLARVVAQYPDIPKPFKRYQVGPVWRADNTQRGRYREFYQFDIDIVGSNSSLADAEVLVLMQNILLALGVTKFTIRVNDRHFLASLAELGGLVASQLTEFYAGLDKWDKIGGAEGVADYWRNHDIKQPTIDRLLDGLQSSTNSHLVIPAIAQAKSLGLKDEHIKIDPTIVRGLDYYTGIVFETSLTDAPEFGSVFSGGRYDDLVSRFSKQSVPAVGSSIGVDRLLAALDYLGLLHQSTSPTQVYVTLFDEQSLEYSLRIANLLRQNNITTDMAFAPGAIGKQLKFADNSAIPLAIIAGPDEVAMNQCTIKYLSKGTEQKIALDQLVVAIQEHRA